MHKIWVIARREYQALVRTKAFIISLVAMPIFMFGGIFLQTFLAGRIDAGDKKVVVLDGTGRIYAGLAEAARKWNEADLVDKETGHKLHPTLMLEQRPADHVDDKLRLELSEQIHRNELFAFVEIDADALKPADTQSPRSPAAPVRIHMESITYHEVGRWLSQAIQQQANTLRLHDAKLDAAIVSAAIAPLRIDEAGLYSKTAKGDIQKGSDAARGISFFLPFALMLLMFISVMAVAQPMLSSVIEEKQQRIAEVLLGSASPFQIMMGKLIGNVGVALTIVALYLVGGYILAAHYGYADLLPTWLLGWFIAFDILACMLFGSIFIAVGAACTDIKESQALLTPVMLIVILPLMVWFTIVQEPLSSFATWASLVPPATPMLMLLRMAASPMVPWWQPVLGIVLVLVTTMAAVFAAGRVFRIGLLMQGKPPKLRELLGWVLRG